MTLCDKGSLTELIGVAVESMKIAVTIIDTGGTILYYNAYAAEILDRKPDHIGQDVHSHHRRDVSNEKLDLMLQEFHRGRTAPFHYRANPYGRPIHVTLSPILAKGSLVGCTQTVQVMEEIQGDEKFRGNGKVS